VSSRFTMPVSSFCRRRAAPTVAVRRVRVALLLRRLGLADGAGPASGLVLDPVLAPSLGQLESRSSTARTSRSPNQ
jgi:hypothetical protein